MAVTTISEGSNLDADESMWNQGAARPLLKLRAYFEAQLNLLLDKATAKRLPKAVR